MLDVFAALTLAAHLLVMNLATAGPLIVTWLEWSRWADDRAGNELTRGMLRASIFALMAGVLLGAVLVALAWHDHGPMLQAAFGLLPARRYWFGAAEILFSLGCLAIHLRVLARTDSPNARRWWRRLLPLAAGTNLAYHFPPLFAMLGVYSTRPESWHAPLSFVRALTDAEVAAHWLHFLLAAATTGGLWLAWLACRGGETSEQRQRWTMFGGRIALSATVLQLVSGLHLLSVVSEPSRDALLGGDLIGTVGFVAAIVASVSLLHRLAGVALVESTQREIALTIATMAAVVLTMVGGLQASRRAVYRTLPMPTRQATAESHNGPLKQPVPTREVCDGFGNRGAA